MLSLLGPGWIEPIRKADSELRRQLRDLPPLESKITDLAALLDQVVRWNRKIDLTAARSPAELVDLYLADAAVLSMFASNANWVDVGSGGGAPGVVLAALCPQLSLTLVEPRAKRVAFLRNALGVLDIDSARVLRRRSETLDTGSFDAAISRATLPPEQWLAEGTRLARREVWLLLARDAAPTHPQWRIDREVCYRWPLTSATRRAVRYAPRRPA